MGVDFFLLYDSTRLGHTSLSDQNINEQVYEFIRLYGWAISILICLITIQ
ncbi:hypothetical protein BJ944DRAFT_253537 [Cunninghamella echinulata]|nr:hypothetical protein BJ944DRAFT_253537 [Cunninghamella echinulata]